MHIRGYDPGLINVHTFLVAETLQCEEEDQEGEGVPVSGGGKEECHQNGDAGHDAPFKEGETKPEEEHNGNRSADSPSEGQQ